METLILYEMLSLTLIRKGYTVKEHVAIMEIKSDYTS